MKIYKSIDIEDALRNVLKDYITVYCRPLPRGYSLPNILISAVGGSSESDWFGRTVKDRFTVNLTSRGKTEAEALDLLTTAIGIIKESQGKIISDVKINAQYSWGNDATRPDLAQCGSTIIVTVRPEGKII